jgi:hypothetical protein
MSNHLVFFHDLTLYEFHSLMDLARQVKRQPRRFWGRLKTNFIFKKRLWYHT